MTTPLLVRILGSEDYGDYAFLLSMFAIITIFSHAGISAGIRKYIVEERDQQGWKEHVFAFYARLAIGLAALGSICLILFGVFGPVERLFGDGFSLYFILLAGMLITNQIFYVFRYTLMGLHFERYSESLSVLQTFLLGVFGLSLAYIGFDVAGVLAGTTLAFLVCAFAAMWILRSRLNLTVAFRSLPTEFPAKELFNFNTYNTVFVFLTVSLYNVDILLLQPMVGSHETGLYKAALVIAEFLWLIPTAVQIIFIQSSSEMWSRDASEEITSMVSTATRYTLVLTTLLLLGIAALAAPFMELYFGPEFGAAVVPMLLLLPGVLGFAVARPIYAIGQGKGELQILIVATGTAAVINLALNLLLIPRYGMAGAAIATSIGYGSMVVFHYLAARRIGYNPFDDLRLPRIAITVGVAAPIIFGLSYVINSGLLSLIIVPPLGFLVYSTLTLRTGAVTADEIVPLLDRAPTPLSDWSIKMVHSIE
ncbi:polysaccharide biosynthesis protein [Halalkalicoccus jeotgali B3]|uniref:Polysaccharide biosynthesis protein n=1 Tax=Halalkalicoccus jeotgali (strain DSM 18796 / CECT 7217 / JCM 14584 / KCTC 4019 / B3) TaxID=795797 RepID=D8J6R7_HALJB|nr:polysaccharide biosynthesis C-terminal domain-containing protein [Halalkalicoccus jeotgali]ADJ13944.1 polysaccharide biosynthesis protein [Halalkalicoccus jeotgali B3]ELY34012.1 polysaccharide biosynthesis protein [Halalkalicoccus jeotgali B3]